MDGWAGTVSAPAEPAAGAVDQGRNEYFQVAPALWARGDQACTEPGQSRTAPGCKVHGDTNARGAADGRAACHFPCTDESGAKQFEHHDEAPTTPGLNGPLPSRSHNSAEPFHECRVSGAGLFRRSCDPCWAGLCRNGAGPLFEVAWALNRERVGFALNLRFANAGAMGKS
jgi:hypothetical protein